MSERNARGFRREAQKVAEKTLDGVAPAFAAVLGNQELLRKRVVQLEAALQGSLLDRLIWMLTGRIRSASVMDGGQKVSDAPKIALTSVEDSPKIENVVGN